MYKLGFYVPVDKKDQVKRALFSIGAGRIGNYDCCAFEYEGIGQFRALEGSNPTIGNIGEVEYVKEVRIEMVFQDALLKDVVKELRLSHPYEEPAYDIIKLTEVND